MDIGVAHGAAKHIDFRLEMLAGKPAAGGRDNDAFDLDTGHAFGSVDRNANRGFRLLHVDDLAALHAARALMADAENPAAMRAATQRVGGFERHQPRDQARDLARAHIEHR